uniref:Uncharacterized protein n=1 Tax=Anas platyrhynchos platyrhynchos TaxID=8840 RepID=A0A493TH53_ANAPP
WGSQGTGLGWGHHGNGTHFLQLEQVGGQLSASLLHSHDTETRATMTMALAGDFIAAGQDADCHILRFSLQPPPGRSAAGRDAGGEKGPRKRKGPSAAAQGETQNQTSEVTVESLHSVRTDFSPDALQKAVRFNADCSLLVTGGADGFLRLWEVGAGHGTGAGGTAVPPRRAAGRETFTHGLLCAHSSPA